MKKFEQKIDSVSEKNSFVGVEKNIENEDKLIRKKSKKRLEKAAGSTVTDRCLSAYREILGIPITKEFLGKRILDLGSGKEAEFAREASEKGMQVFALNPDLTQKKFRNILKEKLEIDEPLRSKNKKNFPVAGLAQELPYKSKVFDSVLSSFAVPFFLKKSKEEYEAAFREIIRVLKSNGKAYLGPIEKSDIIEREIAQKLKEKFKNERFAKIKFHKKDDSITLSRYK